ncbi:organelle RRM domain-containing protein 2, mitochondrial isoform X2 [Solanum lycopersicum]|uniref:organelle RRM domain-containing protein 2, mitochondrial isoform X2 n=1 Tax=Solanum lycopersicum TaxID=4081 RepID=UPI000532ABDA|nr:organelle RRM domain-containing protein 2, mitochondrial isoform X2 [Solanum lycopersicum]
MALRAAAAVRIPVAPRGLSKHTTSESLRNAFSEYGEVLDAKVLTDGITGYSTCCGYVRYQTMEESAAGLEAMDGQFLDGLVIVAEYAKPKPRHPALEDGRCGFASVSDMLI